MELETFKHTVLPLRGKLCNIAIQLIERPEEAEDIVQETFLKMWQMRDKLDGYRSVEALAVTITKNASLDFLKTQKPVAAETELFRLTATQPDPVVVLEQHDAVTCIRKLIGKLPSLQQITIRMKDVEGYEMTEIAEITGTTVETVRVNLSRARKKVREQYLALNK